MAHGDSIRKASEMYGKDLVEELITEVDFYGGDVEMVKSLHYMAKNDTHLDCLEVLYPPDSMIQC